MPTTTIPTKASLQAIFAYGSQSDKILYSLGILFTILSGAVLPASVIVFGELVNSVATAPSAIAQLTNKAVASMLVVGSVGFVLFFLSYSLTLFGASRISNRLRVEYVKALMRQDVTYLNEHDPGELTMAFNDATMDVEEGIGEKLVEGK
jgi:ABC-type multidrug transport system fused ATPase/permease subunit